MKEMICACSRWNRASNRSVLGSLFLEHSSLNFIRKRASLLMSIYASESDRSDKSVDQLDKLDELQVPDIGVVGA